MQKVPAGSYRLRVSNARRGGVLHEEVVQVFVDTATEPLIQLTTAQLSGNVVRDDGGKVEELSGRATLLAGLAEAPADLNAYVRENGSVEARVQNGAFRFDAVKPGNYLLLVSLRGRERTATTVILTADVAVQVAAGKPSATAEGAAPGNGRGQGGAPGGGQAGGRARSGNAPQQGGG
jgi:hypothetical protein